MMQHPHIDDHEIVSRYLNGELGDDEEARFEEHLLLCAACQDEVEADERLGAAMRSLEASGDLPVPAPVPVPTPVPVPMPTPVPVPMPTPLAVPATVPMPITTRRRAWQPLAWAASILFALLPGLFLLRENAQLESELRAAASGPDARLESQIESLRSELREATRPRTDLPLLRLEPVRSEGESAPYRLTLDAKPEWIVLVLEPPEPLGERYRVEIESPTGETAAFDARLDAYGALTLSLYSADLAAGVHRLRASADGGAPFTTAVEFRR